MINFDKIKYLKSSDDMIFNLLLKFGITDSNSLEYVKDYLTKNPILTSKDTRGIKATKLYSPDVVEEVLGKLEEKKEYVCKEEKVIQKANLGKILKDNKDDLVSILEAFSKLEPTLENIVYITPMGVVRLMEKDCSEFHNPNLNALYYNVMLLCLYTADQAEDEKDRVTY